MGMVPVTTESRKIGWISGTEPTLHKNLIGVYRHAYRHVRGHVYGPVYTRVYGHVDRHVHPHVHPKRL